MGERKGLVTTKGSNLQRLLDERLMSLAALAKAAKVSVDTVRRVRDGHDVWRTKFFAIVQALKVKPEEIVPDWDPKNSGGSN
jgi:lambda repressor-like predicted transcriptional regulator